MKNSGNCWSFLCLTSQVGPAAVLVESGLMKGPICFSPTVHTYYLKEKIQM